MKLFFTFFFVSFSFHLLATTYYISPGGNDKMGNGSKAAPWRTLYTATVNVTKPGDIIHVMAGTYDETVKSNLAVGVSIEGEGSSSVIEAKIIKSDFTPIISLTSEEGTNGNQHISNIKLNGNNTTAWAIVIAGRSNFSIHDCIIVDFVESGIVWGGRSDGKDGAPVIYATGNTFYNNKVSNCATFAGYGRGCLNIGGQEGMLIYDNDISQAGRPHGKNGWPIKYWNGGWLKGLKIYNNTITKAPFGGNFNGDNGWDFAIELWNHSGTEIYNNKIQGAIDLVWNVKDKYPYCAYIHDNFIGQPVLNTHRESGIILEEITETAIIEKNKLTNVCTGIAFSTYKATPITNVIIRDNVMENIGTRGTGKGSFGGGIEFYSDGSNNYSVENFTVENNQIIANVNDNPWNGLAFGGAGYIQNLKIKNNTIANFSAGYLTVNPASAIDTLVLENNILYGNANNNEPFFIGGVPKNLIKKNNQVKQSAASASNPSINFKQHILKPFYYDLKRSSVPELVAVLAAICSLLFCRKENIYAYPLGMITIGINIFLSFDEGWAGKAIINFCFLIAAAYGWFLWSKRDKRKHRIIRITVSSKKDWINQFLFFTAIYTATLSCLLNFKNYFDGQGVAAVNSFIISAALTSLWLINQKKVESWFWWIAAVAVAVPSYFFTHQILMSACSGLFLLLGIAVLLKWKKRKIVPKRTLVKF
jgi:nicotinamide mononucleotide transporter